MRGLVLAVAAIAGGCSIHPTPDYNGAEKTLFVAKKIRCEARGAVKSRFVEQARKSKDHRTRTIAERLSEEENFSFKDVKYSELDVETRTFFDRYDGAAIAYDFLFDITEGGGVGANIDLVRPLSAGTLSAGIGAGAELKRQNQRSFILNDTFSGLLTKLSKSDCNGLETGSNWVYPITGGIGLDEMASTFVDLDQTGSLAKGENDAPTMIDTLEFTTGITASAHPSLMLTAAGRRWQTTKFASSETGVHAERTDKNKVTIAFSAQIPPASAKASSGKAGAKTSRASTAAEENAGRAIFNKKTIQFFSNSLDLQRRSGLPDVQ